MLCKPQPIDERRTETNRALVAVSRGGRKTTTQLSVLAVGVLNKADGWSLMSDETRVGHTKADETDVYAGRGTGGRSMTDTAIGVRGWLGNPHTLDEYSRAESIDLFRDDFEARLRGDEEFRESVQDLAGQTLGCWCQRLDDESPACHAEVIAEHADRLAEENDE